jgi:hypothetical protein
MTRAAFNESSTMRAMGRGHSRGAPTEHHQCKPFLVLGGNLEEVRLVCCRDLKMQGKIEIVAT